MERPEPADRMVELVRRTLCGDRAAGRELVLSLTPIVQRRVASAWARSAAGRVVARQDVLDLTQQVLLLLFESDARILRSWEPTRGLGLHGFVGLVAEREAISILRTGRRSAWAETPASDDLLELALPGAHVESWLSSRDELSRLWDCLEQRLSPRGLALFRALLIDEQPGEQVARRFGMSLAALYTFRSRLRAQVRELRGELGRAPAPARAAPASTAHDQPTRGVER